MYVLTCGTVIPLGLVWLRAAGLIGQCLAFGGAAFALFVLRSPRDQPAARALDRTRVLIAAGALLAAAAQAAVLVLLVASFADDAVWPIGAVLGSTVGIVGLIRIAISLGAARAPTARSSSAPQPCFPSPAPWSAMRPTDWMVASG